MTNTHRYLARITLEFTTPFIVGKGKGDFFTDALFVTDANGLPALPGSSIAGVLRHEFERMNGVKEAEELFGFQRQEVRNNEKKSVGRGSRLSLTWAKIHDKNNIPVDGLDLSGEVEKDEILREARRGQLRDHAKLNHKGTVDNKFDETPVSAGHRFTFEMVLEGTKEDESIWNGILALFNNPCTLRFGGKTRRGYGAVKTVSLRKGSFDLTVHNEREFFLNHPVSLAEPSPIQETDVVENASESMLDIPLRPKGFWLIGRGSHPDVDLAPVTAERILWRENKATIEKKLLVPGTAIKGPLAHRTAYYYNLIQGKFADAEAPDDHVGVKNEAVQSIFGYCEEKKEEKGGEQAAAGNIFIDDLFLDLPEDSQRKVLNHVSIDRFTGGARSMSGALFSEEAVYKGDSIPLKIRVNLDNANPSVRKAVRKAFRYALRDLCQGRLAIGAGGGRGNGFFSLGEDKWSEIEEQLIAGEEA